jgi:hypothetical protein
MDGSGFLTEGITKISGKKFGRLPDKEWHAFTPIRKRSETVLRRFADELLTADSGADQPLISVKTAHIIPQLNAVN